MARASDLHSEGQGFDSLILHIDWRCRSQFIDIIEDEIDMMVINRRLSYFKKVSKGVWGMPRLLEATKDVVSCDKPRGLANVN